MWINCEVWLDFGMGFECRCGKANVSILDSYYILIQIPYTIHYLSEVIAFNIWYDMCYVVYGVYSARMGGRVSLKESKFEFILT